MKTATGAQEKIQTRAALARLIPQLKRHGKTVGLTNGVFDLLHAGHVSYLAEARSHCDVLVVSLNTDASVRTYKSPSRPIVPLKSRQRVMAALEAVDYVTSHGERRMRKTLELLKPDLYIKGGDYDVSQLTSRSIVEAYGGSALVLALEKGFSTTTILAKAAEAAFQEGRFLAGEAPEERPAAFLDRDGVIVEAVPYLSEPEKVRLLPGAAAGMKRLKARGLRLVIITNQPGIGMGYFTREDYYRVNSRMLGLLKAEGVHVDAIYVCPHSLAHVCSCRKPETALLERAVAEQRLLVKGSCLFGDREMDMETARAFRIPAGLVGPGDTARAQSRATVQGKTLDAAARRMIAHLKKRACQ